MKSVYPSFALGLAALRDNRLRTFLSTLGVIIGVAAVVAILSVGDGVERMARESIGSTTPLQTVAISPRTERFVDGHRLPNDHWPVFNIADLDSLSHRLPSGCLVTMRVEGTATITDFTGEERALSLIGQAGSMNLEDRLKHGRLLTIDESRGLDPLMVASTTLAQALGDSTGSGLLVGHSVSINGKEFTVVGVAETTNENRLAAMVPLRTASEGFIESSHPRPRNFTIEAPNVEAGLEVENAAKGWLELREGNSWQERVNITLYRNRLKQIQQGFMVFKLLMGSIAGISLITGGIGIMNVLLATVAERTREIGVRKAMGARSQDILAQFLSEAVTVTSLGCVVGLGLGLGTAFAVSAIIRSQSDAMVSVAFTWPTAVLAMGLALIVGVGFGLYPALRASRLSPIDAVRDL